MNYLKSKIHEPTLRQYWLSEKEKLRRKLNQQKIF